jgi:tRNA pseudouridine55 synthase
MSAINGILNLNKPAGMSSARAVGAVKRTLPRGTKIGHAGTLDPFATGVLLLLIGRATKLCEALMDQPKQYQATVKFGATTATDDLDSPEVPQSVAHPPTAEQVAAALTRFIGRIHQQPPVYSALKVGGRRAYELARSGNAVVLKPRPVTVYAIETLEYTWPLLGLRIDCGRGTYIRSIARDLGAALAVGGHLVQLCRTRVGPFTLERSIPLSQLTADTVAKNLTEGFAS